MYIVEFLINLIMVILYHIPYIKYHNVPVEKLELLLIRNWLTLG